MNNFIFISYTLRDKELSIQLLSLLKYKLKQFKIETFVDIIDNIQDDNHQMIVYDALKRSDYMYLIETSQTYNSEWVKKEIVFAKMIGLPIIKVSIQDVKKFIKTNNFIEKPLNKSTIINNISF